MNLNDFNSSKYLGQSDLGGQPILVTIAGFGIEKMRDGTSKPSVTWVQPVKPMLLNRTNRQMLEDIFATSETDQMIGKQVVVFNDPTVSYGGKLVGGLRIRAPKPATPVAAGQPGHKSRAQVQAELDAANQAAQDGPSDEIPF